MASGGRGSGELARSTITWSPQEVGFTQEQRQQAYMCLMARFRNKARAQHSSKMLAPLRDESNPTHRLRPALWGLNEETSPLATAVFERAVCKHLGTDQLPGSRRYCRMLRDDLASKMFVADRGDIGRASIPLRKPCWQQFPITGFASGTSAGATGSS